MQIVILRGIPGSGKSSFAKRLSKSANVIVCSADDYYTHNGRYNFDSSKLKEAHEDCLRRFAKHVVNYGAVVTDPDILIVDNTNISIKEIAPYYELAEAFSFEPLVRTTLCSPETAYNRCIHNVPLHVIERMHRNLNAEFLPRSWRHVEFLAS